MYKDIIDIQEVYIRAARDLFAHGYQLLHIEGTTKSGQHPGTPEAKSKDINAGAYFVRRSLQYVMGRTADVDAYDPFEKREPETVDVEATK